MTEIAVVGAGPAGVAAAVTAAKAGAQVTLIDESGRPGGQYFAGDVAKQSAASFDPEHAPSTANHTIRHGRELLAELQHPNITLRCNTLVWNVTPERILSLFSPDDGADRLQASRLIIASGAYERVMPFPGWTLPGVMTVGAAQLLLKGQGLIAGRRLLLAGTGPLLLEAGAQLVEAGAEIVAVVELKSRREYLAQGLRFLRHREKLRQGLANGWQLMRAGVPTKYGYAVVRAVGDREVEGAVITKVDATGRPRAGTERRLDVDTICLNFGFVPATELPRLADCELYFDPYFNCMAAVTDEEMETSQPGIFAAGETRGIGGVEAALLEGRIAGMAAARQLGYTPDVDDEGERVLRRQWRKARAAAGALGTAFAVKPGLCELTGDDVVVCRCEGVTAGAVRAAVGAGVTRLNGLKPWTRCGMGPCQGRICGPIIARIVSYETGQSLESAGSFTARPPIKPVPLDAVGEPATRAGGLAWEDHVATHGHVGM